MEIKLLDFPAWLWRHLAKHFSFQFHLTVMTFLTIYRSQHRQVLPQEDLRCNHSGAIHSHTSNNHPTESPSFDTATFYTRIVRPVFCATLNTLIYVYKFMSNFKCTSIFNKRNTLSQADRFFGESNPNAFLKYL